MEFSRSIRTGTGREWDRCELNWDPWMDLYFCHKYCVVMCDKTNRFQCVWTPPGGSVSIDLHLFNQFVFNTRIKSINNKIDEINNQQFPCLYGSVWRNEYAKSSYRYSNYVSDQSVYLMSLLIQHCQTAVHTSTSGGTITRTAWIVVFPGRDHQSRHFEELRLKTFLMLMR